MKRNPDKSRNKKKEGYPSVAKYEHPMPTGQGWHREVRLEMFQILRAAVIITHNIVFKTSPALTILI